MMEAERVFLNKFTMKFDRQEAQRKAAVENGHDLVLEIDRAEDRCGFLMYANEVGYSFSRSQWYFSRKRE